MPSCNATLASSASRMLRWAGGAPAQLPRATASGSACWSCQRGLATSRTARTARLRFAPSPTGYLHLGGLRTALFNHLYARKLQGKWILRIEDTDQNRYVPGAVEALQRTLEWAKLDYDEGPDRPASHGPYVQSERREIYQRYAEQLIQSGKAYRDFRAESQQDLTAPKAKGIPLREHYLPPDEDEATRLIRQGKPYVVRLKAETHGIHHHDLVYGDIHFPADPNRAGTEDPILLKSSGWPTYHLANVIDDHEMDITHVLRGEEWLPSLPKHLWLYSAFGWEPPKFAHLPLLVNPDGSKLSKRTGDVRVEDYMAKGFEPEALNNFVALMGYNHIAARTDAHKHIAGSNAEVMSMAEMIESFDIDNVSHSRAAVDLSKLYFLNGRHLALKLEDMQHGGRSELVGKVRPLLEADYPDVQEMPDDKLVELIQITKGTSETYLQLPHSAFPLLRTPLWTSNSSVELFQSTPSISRHYETSVTTLVALLEAHSDPELTQPAVSKLLKDLAKSVAQQVDALPAETVRIVQQGGKKAAQKKANVMLPVRFALTAREKGASLAEIMCWLGKQGCIERLQMALKVYSEGALSSTPKQAA
ncbi:Glutamate--tRNA ligase mitochondrial [Thecaphora frezii]